MTNKYAVGGNVDGWCSKCKMELAHTIIGLLDKLPKKVKCNTCDAQHVYRLKPGTKSAGKSKKTTRQTKSKKSNLETYESHLTGYNLAKATTYAMGGNFAQDEIINHPVFGAGVVVTIVNNSKIEILFKDGPKLLVQNR